MTSSVARRYANALLADVAQSGEVEAVAADMALVADTVRENRELALALASPVVPRDKKLRVVQALFGGKVTERTGRFVELLFAKEREGLLGEAAQAFGELRARALGLDVAHVRVPFELGAESEARLRQALEARTGKRLTLDLEVDPGLVGGIVVRIGDTVYDGSVRHALDAMRERLLDGAFEAPDAPGDGGPRVFPN